MTQGGSRDGRGGGPSTDFDRFEGEIELEAPPPRRSTGGGTPAVGLADKRGAGSAAVRQSAGSAPLGARVEARGGGGPRGNTATARVADRQAGRRGTFALPMIGLALLGIVGLLAYRTYCSYRAHALRFAFHAQAQGLRQELLRLAHPPELPDIGAAVGRFARESGVAIDQVEPSIEPLDAVTINKLPQPTRIALGIASKLPNYRLPYAVVGFRARLRARYGLAEEPFEAQHYTWFDSEGAAAAGGAGGGANTPSAIGRQVEEQLQQRMKRALGAEGL